MNSRCLLAAHGPLATEATAAAATAPQGQDCRPKPGALDPAAQQSCGPPPNLAAASNLPVQQPHGGGAWECGPAAGKELEEDGLSERSTEPEVGSPKAEEEDGACAARSSSSLAPIATLFLLDWDDTMMPTAWIQENGLLEPGVAPTPQQAADLRSTSERVAQTFRMAKQLGRVVIVTNAEEGWVQHSAAKFMPELLPLLWGVQVLSARSAYEHRAPGSPAQWKVLAFELAAGKFCQMLAPCQRANIISIGDYSYERNALFRFTEDVPDCWGKSLKLMEKPHVEQMAREHTLLQESLGWLVEQHGVLDLFVQG